MKNNSLFQDQEAEVAGSVQFTRIALQSKECMTNCSISEPSGLLESDTAPLHKVQAKPLQCNNKLEMSGAAKRISLCYNSGHG